VAALRAAGVPIAIATDHNPGSSPALSLVLMLNMACTLFRLTPEEAFRGVTVHAARALGLSDRGVIAPGMRADLNAIDPARLSVGLPRLVRDLPAGGKRFVQKAEGYVATWVAGDVVTQTQSALVLENLISQFLFSKAGDSQ
jgi:imidazolonepropionase-like amidohydrolase